MGFIRNLPHTLVTSFRATLEEVRQAEVLVHVRDASSHYGEEQKAQVEKVLAELESSSKPMVEVLNKTDLLSDEERAGLLARAQSTHEIPASAQFSDGLTEILRAIDAALHIDPLVEADFLVPQGEGGVLAAIEAGMTMHSRQYEGKQRTPRGHAALPRYSAA